MASLRGATIVILARKHNPTIASKEWLAEKEVLQGPFSQFLHHDALSMAEGKHITLTLDENRLSLSLRNPTKETIHLVTEAALHYVNALPETPYSAVGLNFTYSVSLSRLALSSALGGASELLTTLFGDDYEIETSSKFNFDEFEVKAGFPAAPSRDGSGNAAFNFHSDIAGAQEAIGRIEKHQAALERAGSIVEGLAPGG